MKYLIIAAASLLPGLLHAQKQVTLAVKDGVFNEHSFPSLGKEWTASGLRPSNRITNFIDQQPSEGTGVKPDEKGVIHLDASASPYYKLDGLQLYMEPGSTLTIDLHHAGAAADAVFSGKYAAANQWLNQPMFNGFRQTALWASELLDTAISYATYRSRVLGKIDSMRADLGKLNASAAFKQDGELRLRFLAVSELINYVGFNIYFRYEVHQQPDAVVKDRMLVDGARNFYAAVHDSVTEDVDKLVPATLSTAATDLVEVTGGLQNIFAFDTTYYHRKEPASFTDMHRLLAIARARGGDNFFFSNKLDSLARSLKDADLKAVVEKWRDQYAQLQPGQPAIDVALEDTAGHVTHLSDLKGKSMYVDVWASWCGPCLALKPMYEKLAENYADGSVSFVSISTDMDKNMWKQFIAKHPVPGNVQQYVVADPVAFGKHYQLQYIPRFLLIDASFNFISALSPTPDNPVAGQVLEAMSNE